MSSTALVQSTNTLAAATKTSAVKAKEAIPLPKFSFTPTKSTATAPVPNSPNAASPAVSTPGKWQHPRLDEVIRRQNTTNFDPSNVRLVALNAAALVLSFAIGPISSYLPLDLPSIPYATPALLTFRALLVINIGISLLPLLRAKDACEDIPLTPQQRHALGLPPMSRPATPQEEAQWVTPPRYSRSATPVSSPATSLRAARGSPLSGRGSANASPLELSGSPFNASAQRGRGSPFSPSADRRGSLGSGRSGSVSEFDGFGSPSPIKSPHKASVGLNSKWLYEKGRASNGRASPGISGWGTGSVFN